MISESKSSEKRSFLFSEKKDICNSAVRKVWDESWSSGTGWWGSPHWWSESEVEVRKVSFNKLIPLKVIRIQSEPTAGTSLLFCQPLFVFVQTSDSELGFILSAVNLIQPQDW